jgi:glycerol-3-phosphate acyltransferase PlsY
MSDPLQVLVGLVAGYLIGTIPNADVVARLASRGQVDLRQEGSGNPGGLNAARVLGKGWGLLVIVLDAAKGALAGFVGLAMGDAGAFAAGTGVVAGHCWPVWTGFRGGKGVAAAGGSFVAVFPPLVLLDGLFTGAVALLTHNSRNAMRAAIVFWIAASLLWWAADLPMWWGPAPGPGLVVYSVLGGAMVLARFLVSDRDRPASREP